MSRRMTAPGVWTLEEAGTARIHSKAFSVPAETIPNMRPVLSAGGNSVDWKSTYKLPPLKVKP